MTYELICQRQIDGVVKAVYNKKGSESHFRSFFSSREQTYSLQNDALATGDFKGSAINHLLTFADMLTLRTPNEGLTNSFFSMVVIF